MKTRKDYIRVNGLRSLSNAYAQVRKEALRASQCPILDFFMVTLRIPQDARMSCNGGDYGVWLNLTQVAPYIFKIEGHWTADFDYETYNQLGAYIVLTSDKIQELISLPKED